MGLRRELPKHPESAFMVKLYSCAASGADTATVLDDIDATLSGDATAARFVYAFYGCDHDDTKILQRLGQRFPEAAILGGTSCSGLMNQDQLWDAGSIGLLAICDADGDYGVGAVSGDSDPAAAAQRALSRALDAAGCPGELPELIWLFQAPGHEEAVVEGLRQIVGDTCPIIGGSSADNDVSGAWRQISSAGVMTDGIVVGVLFPSGGIGCSFQGGYEPAGPSGVITRIGFDACGPSGIATRVNGRQIVEIDGRPAAEVFNGWVGGALQDKLAGGGNILLDTTMSPLAVDAGTVDGVSHYVLIHPESISEAGELTTFASIDEGKRVYSMRGDRQNLIDRAGRVSAQAAAALPGGAAALAGGIVVYCAGCMLAVDDGMEKVVDSVRGSFRDAPFIGCFTFGEQGRIADRNVHGNLMISAVAFGQ
jgi:hypothetical protein